MKLAKKIERNHATEDMFWAHVMGLNILTRHLCVSLYELWETRRVEIMHAGYSRVRDRYRAHRTNDLRFARLHDEQMSFCQRIFRLFKRKN